MLSSFSIQRLNRRFKEFTRHHWASDEDRAVWAPRIHRVGACFAELEWRSILEGVRTSALMVLSPHELQSFRDMLAPYGLIVDPLEKIATADGYVSSRRIAREGEPFHYWCAVGRTGNVELLKSAQLSGDDGAVGRLLGYPRCCTRFFNRVWVEEGFMDITWPMAQNAASKRNISPTHVEIVEVSKCNMLLRWLGPRIVFHLPCSFDCRPTIDLADTFIKLAGAAGYRREMDWLEEMFRWPVEWSALYGLAEITTPVATTFAVTDVTTARYRVSYRGAG